MGYICICKYMCHKLIRKSRLVVASQQQLIHGHSWVCQWIVYEKANKASTVCLSLFRLNGDTSILQR